MYRALAVALLLGSPASLLASSYGLELKDGSACNKLAAVAESGATHVCYFEPGKSAKNDYTKANDRAEHVVNVLIDCEGIEILADEDYVDPATPDRKLRRVSAICEE